MAPFALEHESAQAGGIVAISIDRLDSRQESAMGEAVAKG